MSCHWFLGAAYFADWKVRLWTHVGPVSDLLTDLAYLYRVSIRVTSEFTTLIIHVSWNKRSVEGNDGTFRVSKHSGLNNFDVLRADAKVSLEGF